MRNVNYLDLAPYRRSTVGFDRLLDLMNATTQDAGEHYPPFDIEKVGENEFRITLAIAGFSPKEIEIVAQQNLLTVAGEKAEELSDDRYIHRGIAARSFERRFHIADFVIVESATFRDGLLTITLKREIPETMKPRRIEITAEPDQTATPPALEDNPTPASETLSEQAGA